MIVTYHPSIELNRLVITAKENYWTGDIELPVARLWVTPTPVNVDPDICLFSSALLMSGYIGRFLEIEKVHPSPGAFDAFERCFPNLRLVSRLNLDASPMFGAGHTLHVLADGEAPGQRTKGLITVGFDDGLTMSIGRPQADYIVQSNIAVLTKCGRLAARLGIVLLFTTDWGVRTIQISLADLDMAREWDAATSSLSAFRKSIFGGLQDIGINVVAV